MVASTQNLAFVSRLGVSARDADIRVIDVRGLKIQRRLGVVSKLGRPLSAAARAFSLFLG